VSDNLLVVQMSDEHHHTPSENNVNHNNHTGNKTEMKCDYQIGDHIYQWCSFVGIPAVFQHHGIVLDCYWKEFDSSHTLNESNSNDNDSSNENGEWILQIADFSNVDHNSYSQSFPTTTQLPDGTTTTIDTSFTPRQVPSNRKRSFGRSLSSKSSSNTGYGFRTYEISLSSKDETWHKVIYNANWWQRQFHRTGTCTAVSSDPPGLVRARVQFLMDHPHLLPKYDAITANCECVAVWCKTGTWATLQAINWLFMTAAGQVKSAVTVGSIAAATQVTVPASGFWGWMGYTTTVPLLTTQPYLLPAIIGYGVITVAAPTLWMLHAKNHAKRTTEVLNTAFWEQAIDRPDLFVECITTWSALYEPKVNEEQYVCYDDTTSESTVDCLSINPTTKVKDDEVDVLNDEDQDDVVKPVPSPTNEQSTGQQSLEVARST
jgi:hypothetical protein